MPPTGTPAMRSLILTIVLFASPAVAGAAELPPDVQAFIVDRELCDHFREEPADGGTPEQDQRRGFVRESIEIHCPGTDRRLAALKRRYAGNLTVLSRLSRYEDSIEPADR